MSINSTPENAAALTPIPGRRPLAEEAADRLRDLILLEKLEPGAQIRENQLAKGLGISRTPVREALFLLEVEGLVEYSATRRPYVADPSLETLAQNLSVLGALEALAGELSCAHATDAEIERIGRLCETMFETSETAEPLDFFRTDMAFHAAIAEASRNQPLVQTQRQYNARLWRARFISSQRRPDRPRTLEQHQEVYQALAARDGQACARALRSHLETTVNNIAKARSEKEQERKSV